MCQTTHKTVYLVYNPFATRKILTCVRDVVFLKELPARAVDTLVTNDLVTLVQQPSNRQNVTRSSIIGVFNILKDMPQ